jgi:hypothetical protein
VQEMGEARKVKQLGVGQPVHQLFLPLCEQSRAGAAHDGEHWLLDALRVVFGELPLSDGGQLLGVERVGVGDRLLERAGQPVVERRAVAGAEDAAEEDVDRSGFVARTVALERGVR